MLNLNALKIITNGMISSSTKVTNTSGNSVTVDSAASSAVWNVFAGIKNIGASASFSSSSSTGLYFCSTTNPVTIDEVDFADRDNLVYPSGSGTVPAVEFFDDHVDIFTVLTLKNDNSKPMVISEIYYAKYYNNNTGYLLDHTVLDNPVTIPAGSAKSLTYTIRINF